MFDFSLPVVKPDSWLLYTLSALLAGLFLAWIFTRLIQQGLFLDAWQVFRLKLIANRPKQVQVHSQAIKTGVNSPFSGGSTAEQVVPGPGPDLRKAQAGQSPGLPPPENLETGVDPPLLELLVQGSTQLFTRQTPAGVYVYVSAACRSLLGYEPQELIGRSVYDFLHPQDVAAAQKFYNSQPSASPAGAIQFRFAHNDGHYRWFETNSSPIFSPGTGVLAQIVSVSRDITELKQLQLELKQRNHELTTLQSAGVSITSSLDLRFVLDSVTREMANLLGVESCTVAEWDRDKNSVRKVARYDLDGWGDPAVLHQDIRDLASYPVTRSVLEEQIPLQMKLAESTIDPAEKAYMQANKSLSRLVLPMIYQRKAVGLVELEDSRQERVFNYQEVYLAKWLANLAASAVENARLYEQARQEIAERQRAEAALAEERALLARRVEERTADLSRANAELARAARLKDEFLANVSHELRTPLNTILGSGEILRLQTFGQVNDKQLKYVHNIEESGRHLLLVINDILDLSKAEAGRLVMEMRPVIIETVSLASLRLIKELANKKGLQISQSFSNLVVPTLTADELRLKQILVNLLSNAVKFTPEGGRIGLEVVGDVDRQAVRFTVWDTGIGISAADLSTLFKPFVQVESSLARQYGGSGLGLSLVARMTELHGGGVSVESQVGQGSRFTVSFPWPNVTQEAGPKNGLSEAVSEPPGGSIARQKGQPGLVLLAEDNEENISILVDFLKVYEYRVIVARNGREAVERSREEKPDIVLMDIQMPGMDGLEATQMLRLDPTLADTPIIALTALAMSGDRERCLAAGATDYLSKPLHLRGLVNLIETYLNRDVVQEQDLH